MAPPFFLATSDFTTISQFAMKLLCTFLAAFILLSILNRARKASSKEQSLPSGPPRIPVIGNLHQLVRKPLHRSIHDLSKKYGDLMLLKFGSVPTLVISSADLAREIIRNHDVNFSGRAANQVTRKLTYNCIDVIFCSYGEYWREMRKVSVVELLGSKRVQMFEAVRADEVRQLVDTIASSSSSPIDLSALLRDLSINVLTRVAFGGKLSGAKRNPAHMLEEVLDLVGAVYLSDFFPWLAWLDRLRGLHARCEKIFQELDELYEKVIEEHLDPNRGNYDHEDLVDVLLRLQKDQTQSSFTSNRNFVKAIITDMLIAGTETTGTTLVWIVTEMIRNPEVLSRATEEVRKCVQNKLRVEESDLSQLLYLKAIVKETMRLHPPVPLAIPRETMEPCKLTGYEIPAKMQVLINITSISMDSSSWKDPDMFFPERFLESSIDFRGQHFEFVPFGVGRRICPGINFANVVLELVVANLLYCFDWELPQGVTRENIDVEDTFSLAAPKKTPLILVAKPV